MTVVNNRFMLDQSSQAVGRQGVEVVGKKQVSPGKQEEKEKPEVIFGIEQWPLPEYQPQPAGGVTPGFQTRGF